MKTLQEIIAARTKTPLTEETLRDLLFARVDTLFDSVKEKLVNDTMAEIKAALEPISKFKGDKGEKGDEGKQGQEGKKGADSVVPGPMGPQGSEGKPSTIPGPKGDQGPEGKAGKNGEKGKDGSPDTPEQIAAKLNKTEASVDQSVIKGLPALMTNIEKAFKRISQGGGSKGGGSKGGGMGQVQHERKSVSSATTSVTSNFNISGGGLAIWAYYNGQMIMRGTDYTVSGKTIPLLFTPQDNTVIDIIYFRA